MTSIAQSFFLNSVLLEAGFDSVNAPLSHIPRHYDVTFYRWVGNQLYFTQASSWRLTCMQLHIIKNKIKIKLELLENQHIVSHSLRPKYKIGSQIETMWHFKVEDDNYSLNLYYVLKIIFINNEKKILWNVIYAILMYFIQIKKQPRIYFIRGFWKN